MLAQFVYMACSQVELSSALNDGEDGFFLDLCGRLDSAGPIVSSATWHLLPRRVVRLSRADGRGTS